MVVERNEEQVLHEYQAVAKYRVRVVHKKTRAAAVTALDIREYVTAEKFEGFTRRGIRLFSREEMELLRDELTDALTREVWFPKK